MASTVDKIEVCAEGAQQKFREWLDRGDAVGVFSNHELSTLQHRPDKVFLPLSPDEQERVQLGDRAPDGDYGPGWRYLLDELVTDLSRFTFVEPERFDVEKAMRNLKFPNVRLSREPSREALGLMRWLGGMDHIDKVTIGRAAFSNGLVYAGAEYQDNCGGVHRYLVGCIPTKSNAHPLFSRVVFQGDSRVWYLVSYLDPSKPVPDSRYHPFGHSFALAVDHGEVTSLAGARPSVWEPMDL